MNIILKQRMKDHVVIFWEKTQDEELQKLFPFSIQSLEEALKLYKESLKDVALSYGKVIYYGGKYIGDIWCYCIDEINEKMAMLSIVIFEKELWGKGIATRATKDFIKEVFSKYELEKIGAYTYTFNNRSIGLLEKAGFAKVETFVEDEIESIYFEIRR
ncbi:GNAT family N-acetyltransferase [Sedimentibacter sp. zth1]|uniref:GNAT family N-acetyltransferase n=1 Tax=Sedimentibacter sp. zth1 TaxID=2816908 RepID=UPI001A923D1C|nr:GNAT family N-acetyltransferase [Sedimentibacter sp. zth1]QSX06655.1 GNAT family N-acetyltransferase [Sedimentibacter sp. zth1]